MYVETRLLAASTAVLLGLLLPATVRAADPPLECTTEHRGDWTITATGPTSVECPDGGECTAMTYQVVANNGRKPKRIGLLVEKDVTVVSPTGSALFEPCEGDRRTRVGLNDCSRQTIRFDVDDSSGSVLLELVVAGNKAPSQSSIVIKNGRPERCAIASLGVDLFDPNAQLSKTQQIHFKGCTVDIPINPTTGEGGTATITGDNCAFVANAQPVSAAELLVNGTSVGSLTFGDAAVSSGASSCTTKVISRRLYTWCTCADIDGDHVPDDPIPPCPETVP